MLLDQNPWLTHIQKKIILFYSFTRNLKLSIVVSLYLKKLFKALETLRSAILVEHLLNKNFLKVSNHLLSGIKMFSYHSKPGFHKLGQVAGPPGTF